MNAERDPSPQAGSTDPELGPLDQMLSTSVDFETLINYLRLLHEEGTNFEQDLRNYVFERARGRSFDDFTHDRAEKARNNRERRAHGTARVPGVTLSVLGIPSVLRGSGG